MSQPKRDWSEARRKVEEEGYCRVCGKSLREVKLEAAHIIGRSQDQLTLDGKLRRKKTWKVEPVRIVPLCGPSPQGCHGAYDEKRLDLLPHLDLDEQVQAAVDSGGIELARRKLCPSAYREGANAHA